MTHATISTDETLIGHQTSACAQDTTEELKIKPQFIAVFHANNSYHEFDIREVMDKICGYHCGDGFTRFLFFCVQWDKQAQLLMGAEKGAVTEFTQH